MVNEIVEMILEEQYDDDFTEEEIESAIERYFTDIGELMFGMLEFGSLVHSIVKTFGKEFLSRLNEVVPDEPERYDATNGEYWYDDDETDEEKEKQIELANEFGSFWEDFLDWDFIQSAVFEKTKDEWAHRVRTGAENGEF